MNYTFAPGILSLISRPNETGYFCPVCSAILLKKGSDLFDLACEAWDHVFGLYCSLESYGHMYYFYLSVNRNNHRYHISFNASNGNFNTNVQSLRGAMLFSIAVNDYNLNGLEPLLETIDTYLLFS